MSNTKSIWINWKNVPENINDNQIIPLNCCAICIYYLINYLFDNIIVLYYQKAID